MKNDDSLWKPILENVFKDFLLFFFPNARKIFDFSKGFQFLDKELEQLFPVKDMAHPKFVDKLVKVFTLEGEAQFILVHIEVQGYRDKHFSERMYTYFYRICDKYKVPVTAIAIFTDGNKSYHPNAYEYNFLGTSFNYTFNTYKIIEQDEKALAASTNPFAIIVLTVLLALKKVKVPEEEVVFEKVELARNLMRRRIPLQKIRAIFTFLDLYLDFAKEENNAKFDTEMEAITPNKKNMGIEEFLLDRAEKKGIEKGIQKGIEKGIEKGRVKGIKEGIEQGIEKGQEKKSYEVVQNLLAADKFTISEIANFANVTEVFVKKVRRGLKK